VTAVPAVRIRDANGAGVRGDGDYVLYWMIASRRVVYNFALDRALERCRELRKSLVIFEALRCGYQWASERLANWNTEVELHRIAAFAPVLREV
jgi:deoxyribodipyrimidine photo-lyase